MKTTLDLSDDLLSEAKMVALQRRTTLRALVEHALRREIHPLPGAPGLARSTDDLIELSEHGVPRLRRRGKTKVTTATVRRLMDEEGI